MDSPKSLHTIGNHIDRVASAVLDDPLQRTHVFGIAVYEQDVGHAQTLSFTIDGDTVSQNGSEPGSGHIANALVGIKGELPERFRHRVDIVNHGLPDFERGVIGEFGDTRLGQVWMGGNAPAHFNAGVEDHTQQQSR